MADEVILPGTGDTIAADLIAGSKYQRVKLIHGADGVNAGDVSTANPLPVSDAGGSLTVDVGAALPAGSATIGAVNLAQYTPASGRLPVDGSGVTQPVSGTVGVSGTVPVSGTFWQATQPVSGTVAATQSGTWNVGTVTTVTTVSAVTAITNALPAGTNLLGKVSSGLDTSTINNGTTALVPKFAAISASTSGNSTAVAAVTSKKIRVLSYRFQSAADVDVKFRSSTAGDLTGAMSTGGKGGGGGAAFSPIGHFETTSGEALQINLSGAVAVAGHLCYVEV